MFSKLVWLLLLLLSSTKANAAAGEPSFIYNGFKNENLSRDGFAEITQNGLLQLTNLTSSVAGHAFHTKPFVFKPVSNGTAISFSTTFVFSIVPKYLDSGGHGMAFVIAPSTSLGDRGPTLGLFKNNSRGDSSSHIVAVEFDTVINTEFNETNENHVGINLNSINSTVSVPPKYRDIRGKEQNLTLKSGRPMQVWIEYDGPQKHLTVAIAPIRVPKPKTPLLSLRRDISSILLDSMYVGFSATTGSQIVSSHYVLGWSFQMNGQAQALDLSNLPKLPRIGPKKQSKALTIALPVTLPIILLIVLTGIFLLVMRRRKYAEIFEEWEQKYGPHRFSYKDLYAATKGFKERGLLGRGGFGRVYKGVLPGSKTEVAVKRVAHDSKQGITEFIAEIVSIGQLRHRNLVQLLGYCRRKGELLLVYDYMPNGSLDKFLFCQMSSKLNWSQRFQIIKGVASGLVYLHEEWVQVVIHRDIKASNVLLDAEFNGKLGDFGLARLYDHGENPQTTHVVGTLGYLAPEFTRTGKATPSTDVYGFGAFLLEVACGRRPIEPLASHGNMVLVDWVISAWSKGRILETVDPNLGGRYVKEEIEMVLKLGLLCSHDKSTSRPTMRQILQFLDKDAPLPELNPETIAYGHCDKGMDDFTSSFPSLDVSSTSISASFSGR